MQKRTLGNWTSFFVKLITLVLLATAGGALLFTLANFSDHESKLIFFIKTNDAEMTKKELISLHYFYDLSRRWKVQRWADKYLFRDAPFYEVADAYLIHDWNKVQEDLKSNLDDARAYPYGNAKFRQAQAMYNIGKKKEAIDMVLGEIHGDFEKALRICLDSGVSYVECYNHVWNFDLTDNKKDAEEALKGPQPKTKFILGPPKDKGGKVPIPAEGDNKKPGGGKEGEEGPNPGGWKKKP